MAQINQNLINELAEQKNALNLEQAILVTGGAQRIGEYLVRQFLQQTEHPVIFTYRTQHASVSELQRLGAYGVPCDFANANDLQRLAELLKQHCLSMRAVIHNASLWLNDEQAPVGSENYKQMFQVHVDAPIFLNRAMAPLLKSSAGLSDIISLSDFRVAKPGANKSAYFASKAALQTVSKSFAVEFAPDIKVNDIAPSLIIFNANDKADYKKMRLHEALLPIEPGAEVVWQAVNYLLQNPYVTGSVLQLNGGRNLT